MSWIFYLGLLFLRISHSATPTLSPTVYCPCPTHSPTLSPVTASPTTKSPVQFQGLTAFRTLRGGCRIGHPPFSEWNDATGQCEGMSYELFKLAAQRANISWTMARNARSTSSVLQDGTFDISVSVTSISASRTPFMYFSQPIVDVYFVAALKPQFQKQTATLLDALFDRSVLYLFSLMVILIFVMATIILLAEGRIPTSELMCYNAWYKRLLWAIEISLTNALGLGGGAFSSQITRSLQAVFIISMYFFSCLFTAILTSTLTITGVVEPIDVFNDLRGLHIACGENPDMATFLSSSRVGALTQYNDTLAPIAFGILNGSDFTNDGFVTSIEEAQKFLSLYPDANFILSTPFTITGYTEPRALALSHSVPIQIVTDFNVAMSALREEGVVADLLVQFVPAAPAPNDVALGITSDRAQTTQTVAIVVYVLFFVLVGLFFWRNNKKKKQQKADTRASKASRPERSEKGSRVGMPLGPSPYMITTFKSDGKGGYTPLSCSTISPLGLPLHCQPDAVSSETLKVLLSQCVNPNAQ